MKYSANPLSVMVLALSLAMICPALSQPAAPETVTVTGLKIGPVPRDTIDKLLKSRIAPTKLAGKIARWKTPLCPDTLGLIPAKGEVLSRRIKDVAASVGASVATGFCATNVMVVFTNTPQEFMDQVAAHRPELLGYHDTPSQGQAMAKMTSPIQAWYATQTRDARGQAQPDDHDYCSNNLPNESRQMPDFAQARKKGAFGTPLWAKTCYYAASGLTLNDGVSSDFVHVLVVADGNQIGSYTFNTVADYIAMFVLSQTGKFDSCDEMPSIANFMTQGCDARWKAAELTAGDIAYLRALYKMKPGGSLHSQQSDIASEMGRDLGADK